MNTMLHVVHPHTYKAHNNSLIAGPIEEHAARDRAVSDLIASCDYRNIPVLVHREFVSSPITEMLYTFCLSSDPHFAGLLERPHIVTRSGEPIPDERPEKVSEAGWEYIQD